jgi:hypothetical protein
MQDPLCRNLNNLKRKLDSTAFLSPLPPSPTTTTTITTSTMKISPDPSLPGPSSADHPGASTGGSSGNSTSVSQAQTAQDSSTALQLGEPTSQVAPRRTADPWHSLGSTSAWASSSQPTQPPPQLSSSASSSGSMPMMPSTKLGESSRAPFLTTSNTAAAAAAAAVAVAVAPEPSSPSPKRLRTHSLSATSSIVPRRTKSEQQSAAHRRRRRSPRVDDVPPVHQQFDLANPCIPSLHPPVNRTTLKELELESILRNPQLRK